MPLLRRAAAYFLTSRLFGGIKVSYGRSLRENAERYMRLKRTGCYTKGLSYEQCAIKTKGKVWKNKRGVKV